MTSNLFNRIAGVFTLACLVVALGAAIIGNVVMLAVFSAITALSFIVWVLSYVIRLIDETIVRQVLR
ncbi:hypothetical protein CPT_Mendera_171 [Stenotrophomonas phage Mendera]|uniref:Uncharacterized protein n=1 Tax=Stenotrophomonas phage Mendera TaxID=2650877 RepID=A0A5P8PIZ4_9CAUD|nr:hypothetical protein HWC60_gp244 [Stenotrophomonas phage Mendera]QFR56697.1 hypothetical protein CPT_Mendera_171 [Stenotrophomonas phage Mendera]QYW02689.1 putative membrane protein [Stenotrophomonas phage Marzo]